MKLKRVIILRGRCNGWCSKERISSIENYKASVSRMYTLFRVKDSTRNYTESEKDRREYVFPKKEIFARVKSTIRAWKRFCEIYLPVYIVHCNYNLYLFVIDTFIGRLLLLVASVISQAQISETGEPCETLSFRGFVAYPHYRCIIYFLRFSSLLYTRYCCDRPIVQDVHRIIEVHRD